MANAKLAVLAVLVLVQISCGVARHHHGDPRHHDSSPAVLRLGGMRAVMTVNVFSNNGEEQPPAECDGKYHSDNDLVVALSTRWYAGGKRCHKKIRITSVHNGRTVEATVVDECISRAGCKNNIVDTSRAVWKKLGLDTNIGEVPVTWSDA